MRLPPGLLPLLAATALLVPACATGTTEQAAAGGDAALASPSPTVVETFEQVPPLHPSVDDYEPGTVEVVADDGTVHHVAVRIARTPEEQQHGLMEVPELPDGAGMWFHYGEDRTGSFWMKNTLVPLDIAYIGEDGGIVSVADAVPCEAEPCPTYPPEGAYRHVLEVPNGYLDRIGASTDATVRLVEP